MESGSQRQEQGEQQGFPLPIPMDAQRGGQAQDDLQGPYKLQLPAPFPYPAQL